MEEGWFRILFHFISYIPNRTVLKKLKFTKNTIFNISLNFKIIKFDELLNIISLNSVKFKINTHNIFEKCHIYLKRIY